MRKASSWCRQRLVSKLANKSSHLHGLWQRTGRLLTKGFAQGAGKILLPLSAHSSSHTHDIQPTNILVDENLYLKLADFQGNFLSEDGEVILAGWSGEPCRYFCPRDDEFEVSSKTDLFALGSTLYFIMTGHEVFLDIIGGENGWVEKVRSRFASGVFPEDFHACDAITRKCWERQYGSASEALEDIRAVEKELS